MRIITLQRILSTYRATAGQLIENGWPFMAVLENPWRFNQNNVSCIPNGDYICQRWNSPNFGWTFKVLNVPSRTDILFHWGNWEKDTKGCFILGEKFDILSNEPAVINSQAAFADFMNRMKGVDEFNLLIR